MNLKKTNNIRSVLRLLNLLLLVPLLASCQREMDGGVAPDIKATVETEPETRTSLSVDESGAGTIYWNRSDTIDVFFGTKKATYISQNSSDAATATFKTTATLSGTDLMSTNIWGLYPSNSSSSCNGSSITTVLPSTQYGVPNTFDRDLFMGVAHSTSRSLQFYNVCGGIKFNLAYDDIKKVTFRGNNNENLAGTVSISFVNNVPQATIVNGVKEITLTPKTDSTFTKGADYYFVLLPGTLSSGFTMTFTATDGTTGTLNYTDKSVTIKRSVFARKGNMDVYAAFTDERQPNNVIYYTSSDGNIVTPYSTDVFGANIVSNEYVGGRGVITFDGDVTSIGEYAFSFCSTLATVKIPDSVKGIFEHAFIQSGLLSIDLSSVESIENNVFAGCDLLSSVFIPKSVSSIGPNPFNSCDALASIIVEPDNPFYDSRENCNAIIETATDQLIVGCKNTVVPSSVSSIGNFAFYGCIGLTDITIPSSVTQIGGYAFGWSGLTSIFIPNSVSSIDHNNPFVSSDLSSITVASDNPCYDSRDNCNAIIRTDSNELVVGCKKTVIPESVTSIGYTAFKQCHGLTSIIIPSGVKSIDSAAFEGCDCLISVTIRSSLNSINSFVFSGCISLTSFTFPTTVSSIGRNAFMFCRGLASIEIPSMVSSIGDSAFYGCSGLTSVSVNALQPPLLSSESVFANTNNCPIYVPAGSVNAYKTADGWNEYAVRIHAMGEYYEAVDLGLSVKWAAYNLGATEPEEYGDYYAWGETEPYYSSQDPLTWKDGKTGYNWASYKWCNGSSTTLTRYCPSDQTSYWGGSGAPDGKTEFKDYNYADDAARQRLGGKWRMPTDAEWAELRQNCTWTWTTQNGVIGYKATSNKAGFTDKSIFLPAAGYREFTYLDHMGLCGEYWSSSSCTDSPSHAWNMHFDSGNVSSSGRGRCLGQPVRPVSE